MYIFILHIYIQYIAHIHTIYCPYVSGSLTRVFSLPRLHHSFESLGCVELRPQFAREWTWRCWSRGLRNPTVLTFLSVSESKAPSGGTNTFWFAQWLAAGCWLQLSQFFWVCTGLIPKEVPTEDNVLEFEEHQGRLSLLGHSTIQLHDGKIRGKSLCTMQSFLFFFRGINTWGGEVGVRTVHRQALVSCIVKNRDWLHLIRVAPLPARGWIWKICFWWKVLKIETNEQRKIRWNRMKYDKIQ